MNKEVGEKEVEYAKQSDLDKLEISHDTLKDTVTRIERDVGIQGTKVETLQLTLDKISTNVSRTMWTVVGGIILLVIKYFFNPPAPQLPTPGTPANPMNDMPTPLLTQEYVTTFLHYLF